MRPAGSPKRAKPTGHILEGLRPSPPPPPGRLCLIPPFEAIPIRFRPSIISGPSESLHGICNLLDMHDCKRHSFCCLIRATCVLTLASCLFNLTEWGSPGAFFCCQDGPLASGPLASEIQPGPLAVRMGRLALASEIQDEGVQHPHHGHG